MIVKALTNGSVVGTGTVKCESYIIGGILVSVDGTNVATVILRRDNAEGKQIIKIATKTAMWISAPFSMEDTQTVYYAVTGTGAAAQLYEWVQ